MITLNFDVNDQTLTRQDENTVAANSRLVHVCEFSFSSEWDGRGKVATFKKRDLMLSVIVDDATNSCVIPPEILQSENKIDVFELSVCGADGNSTITSTIVRVPILAGTWDPFTEEITPTLFEQIMQKIDEIEKGEVSPELIYEAVTEYMEAHPLEPIIADDVAAYFVEHAEDLKGDKGDTGATPSITATAEVNNAVGTPSVTVTKTGTAEAPNLNFAFQNLKGVKGDTGATPTISAAATVDNTTGTPAVNVTKAGTDAAPEFTFAFSGLKGPQGNPGTPGNGIVSIEKTATSGLVDTYTITFTDGNTATFTVSNGLGIKSADINANGHLIITYSDDTTYDAGALSDIYATAADIDTKVNDVWKAQGELGAKNLLRYPYKDGSSKLNFNGVDFVVDKYGILRTSGTTTQYVYYDFTNEQFTLPKGDYILSCGCERTERIVIGIWYRVVNPYSSTNIVANSTKQGSLFTITQEMADEMANGNAYLLVRIMCNYDGGVDWNGLIFYPIIYHAEDPSDIFQPYAPTNYELMQKDNEIINNFSSYPSFAMFEKFGVIGDSYSSGYIAPDASVSSFVTNYNLSWGQVAARRNGNTCYNFSKAGLTTKTWLSDATYGKQALLAETALQLYVVCLGINDYTNADYPLGTSADIGTQNDSFYGYYSQIVDAIIAHAPQAKIILSTMRDGRTGGGASFSATDVNNAIKTIASHYNIPCVEPSDNELFRSAYYINKMSRVHPTAQVYSAMAKAYEWLIEKAMEDYFDYFKDYVG